MDRAAANPFGGAPAGDPALAVRSRVDRDDPLPLWAQVEADLRRRLARGEFGERFPTDMELVGEYGVSRHTVRDAVGRLCGDGLLERRRGRGTVVRRTEFEQPLDTLYSLFRSIEAQGVDQHSVVRVLEETADEPAAGHLELPPAAPLVHLRRLRLAGGEPLAVDESWLPAELARPLLAVDLTHSALYGELAAWCGVLPVAGWERIRPVVPARPEREELALPNGEAALAIERLARDEHGRALEWRTSLVRGDRYGVVARWTGASRPSEPTLEPLSRRAR